MINAKSLPQQNCNRVKQQLSSLRGLVSRRSLYLLGALAFGLHNTEEAIAASRMLELMQSRAPSLLRDFYAGIEVSEFRISLLILTALGVLVAAIAAQSPTKGSSSYVMLVFGGFIGLNALAHIGLTFAVREYMPGLLSALVLTLPASIVLLARGRRECWVSSSAYWTVLPVAVLIHGPVMVGFIRASIGVARAISRGVV